jgi:hypothetical protein
MASAKLIKALASQKVKIRKSPRISGEVILTFRPLYNKQSGKVEAPKPISIQGFRDIEPLRRSDVTIENLRNSNLEDLVRRQAVVLL